MEALRSVVGTARRRPAKLAYFVISLGLSFGFVAAVATLAHASWFRLPVGVEDRDYVTAMRTLAGGSIEPMSLRDFDEIARRVPEVSWFYVMPVYSLFFNPASSSGVEELLLAHLASPRFFEHLGVRPAFGTLAPTQRAPAAVIADEIWRRSYGRQDIIGEYLTIEDGTPIPIIGVAPPGFEGPVQGPANVWLMNLPLEITVSPAADGVNAEGKRTIAYMQPNVTVFGVIPEGKDDDAEFAAARDRLAEHRFDSKMVWVELESDPSVEGMPARSKPYYSAARDSDRVFFSRGLETSPDKRAEVVQRTLWLALVVAMLLLMAFVSVVEFLLAEHVSREDEQNVRIAVGAAPMDLFGRALAENLLLAAAMGVVGWLAAGYALDVLLRVEPFASYLREIAAASWIAGTSLAGLLLVLALVVCLAFVSWFVSRSAAALVRSGKWLQRTTRQFLLLVCLASFVVVLSLAGRYFGDARVSLGLANPHVAVVHLRDPNWEPGSVTGFQLAEAIDAIEALHGVRAAAAATLAPVASKDLLHIWALKIAGTPGLEDVTFFENHVTSGFFRTVGVELVAGRMFEDNRTEIVVSRAAAEALGGVDAALGAPLTATYDGRSKWARTVVGVVGDVSYGDYTDGIPRMIYAPKYGNAYRHRWLVDAEPWLDVADALTQLPQYQGWEVHWDTPAQRFRKQFLGKRSVDVVLAVAAGFALVLALSGVGNSLARNIAETRSRIGIRFALGATPAELALAQSATSVRELVVVAAVVGGAGIAAKWWAPAFTEALELWWLAPAFACLALVCMLLTRFLVGQLARRHTISALVDGSVTEVRGKASG